MEAFRLLLLLLELGLDARTIRVVFRAVQGGLQRGFLLLRILHGAFELRLFLFGSLGALLLEPPASHVRPRRCAS